MTSPKQPLGPNQQQWLAALRSGEYEQGRGQLETIGTYHDGKLTQIRPNTLCCLGVAARLFATEERVEEGNTVYYRYDKYQEGDNYSEEKETCGEIAPPSVIRALGLWSGDGGPKSKEFTELTVLNDGRSEPRLEPHTFAQIADIIETNPEAYFSAPK